MDPDGDGDEAEQAGGEPQGAQGAEAAPEKGPLGMPAHGTKKIKVGLVVPDDFPLPPGYVRHYQTTDKGQMLPAILMFHPDHPPVDESGRPVPVTADGVVPPELAPSGLEHTWLDVPDDAYSGPGDSAPPTEAEKAEAEKAADGEDEGSAD